MANRTTRDGPNKLLATELRISPGRIGEFLKPVYWLNVVEQERPLRMYPDLRVRKTVSGFANSVERALQWLQKTTFSESEYDASSLTTEAIVHGYWPKTASSKFHNDIVAHAIQEGKSAAIQERSQAENTEIRVELWVPAFATSADFRFYSEYGTALVRGIDPLGTVTEPIKKTLAEILSLPGRKTAKDPRIIAAGPYCTLDRRFQGLNFVTFPAVRYPLLGLIASLTELSAREKQAQFRDLLAPAFHLRRFVVDHDVGHIVVNSMFSKTPGADKVQKEPLAKLDALPVMLQDEIKTGSTIALIADPMVIFEAFAFLTNNNLRVRVVAQSEAEPDFAFLGGMMYREEEQKFGDLLEESQKQLFRSDWRVRDLLLTFLDRVDSWLRGQSVTDKVIDDWPTDAPIFVFPTENVAEYIRTAHLPTRRINVLDKVSSIVDPLKGKINNMGHQRLALKLFKFVPEVEQLRKVVQMENPTLGEQS
jgi:hypothetical protein